MVVVVVLLIGLGQAPSGVADETLDHVVYLDATGCFLVGLPEAIDPINSASFVLTPQEGFHRLRLQLSADPQGLEVDTPLAAGTLFYRWEVRLFDNLTGEPLVPTYTYHGDGQFSYVAPDESPIRVELSLAQGAEAQYHFRISALRDPEPLS